MEKQIQELHEKIKGLFPDAVCVNIMVNSEGINVEPTYKTNLVDYSMRTISGNWVNKVE